MTDYPFVAVKKYFGDLSPTSPTSPTSLPDSGRITAWIGTSVQHTFIQIDSDPVRMPGQIVPVAPAIDDVAALFQFGDCGGGEAPFDVQRVLRNLAQLQPVRVPCRVSSVVAKERQPMRLTYFHTFKAQ
jgi:hypothetical protein